MGAGIAKLFKEKYGRVPELRMQDKRTGDVAWINEGIKCLFYLITKRQSSGKPTYEALTRSLLVLKDLCEDLHI